MQTRLVLSMFFCAVLTTSCGTSEPIQGPPGARGAKGDKGDKGEKGDPADSESGSRLKARFIVGGDGSKQRTEPPDWLDTDFDSLCTFRSTATVQETRCLPLTFEQVDITETHLNATCTKLVLLVNPSSSDLLPKVAHVEYLDLLNEVFVKVGSEFKSPPPAVFHRTINGCEPYNPLPVFVFYDVDILSPDAFVPGEITVDQQQ